ncbi:MAG: hypothetical protein WEG40_22650 [Candidatus Rokuibacteriota bacterium]
MTVEEALLAVVGAVAVVLLFLGLVEALEGDPRARVRGRGRRHGPPQTPRAELARRTAPPPPPTGFPPPAMPEADAARRAPPAPAEIGAFPRDARSGTAAEEWRDRVAALIRGREIDEARQLLETALARGEVGLETAGFLIEVCSTAVARDLWRLRRALRRGGGDEAPLGGSLEATRVLLEAPVAQGLPREQRRRVSCRLWRGHTRLGLRRWRAGNFEAAVEVLFQARGVRDIDERRRRLARDLLVRTLEDMAGQSLELIPQLLGDGDRAAALEQAQRLLGHIRRTREEGVSAEDLAVAASRAQQLLGHIEQASVR